jgi:DNA repair photolyase
MAIRFKRIKKPEEWKEMKPVMHKITKGYRKVRNNNPNLYDVMFPSSHDITPESLDNCLIVLKKLLKAGNSVLITTKPSEECIKRIVRELEEYKPLICFRFTITSFWDRITNKYEPFAPLFVERFRSAKFAFERGFKTSLSIEPLLDRTPITIIRHMEYFINDTIWIGIMSGKVPKALKAIYSKKNLKEIYQECQELQKNNRKKIRFKDSIVNKLNLKSNKLEV